MTFVKCVAVLIVACVSGAVGYYGGSEAKLGDYPYFAIVRSTKFCGGAIISEHLILTAAHCLQNEDTENYTITVGTNNVSSGGRVYKAEKIVPHPNFKLPDIHNDIGYIKIKGEIEFNKNVNSIPLATVRPAVGVWVRVMGFSPVNKEDLPAQQFQNVKVMDLKKCKDIFKKHHLDDGIICTLEQCGSGTCHGDSGSPLIYNKELVGVHSFAPAPCFVGLPDGFTSVVHHKTFIDDALKN